MRAARLVVLLGKPGSGKDTQAEMLQSQLNYKLIKTGRFVRELSLVSTKVAQTLEQGGLVDNTLVNKHVASELKKSNFTGNILTDGYPRDLSQAQWFDKFLDSQEMAVDHVILLDIPDRLATTRLLARRRQDDQIKIIQNRFKIYRTTTQKVVDYYLDQGKLIKIDATGSPVDINRNIKKVIA